jgi:Glycosyltransferase family 87
MKPRSFLTAKTWTDNDVAVWVRLATIWLVLVLVHLLDWGQGFRRGLALVVLLLFVLGAPETAAIGRRAARMAIAALLALSTAAFAYGLLYATPIDIGESGIRAINAFLADWSNPYSTQVDEVDVRQPGHFFGGYKYFPLTLILYTPGVALLGVKGLYLTNFLFYLGSVWLVHAIARHLQQAGHLADPALPVIVYISSVTVLHENFIIGVNDGIIAFFALAAVLAAFRGRETTSALLLGCAIGTKWTVGGLFFLALLPYVRHRIAYCLWAAVVPAATIMPFLLWNPADFISNTVVFFRHKTPDSTGFLTKFSPGRVAGTIRIGLFVLFWVVWGCYAWLRKSERTMVLVLPILMTVFFLIPLESHRNHLLWFIPVIGLTYAVRTSGPSRNAS